MSEELTYGQKLIAEAIQHHFGDRPGSDDEYEAADAIERLERERDEWRDAAHLSACEAHSGLLEETEAEASALAEEQKP